MEEKIWVKTHEAGEVPAVLVKKNKKMSRVRYETAVREKGYSANKGDERTVANKFIRSRSK